MEYRIDALGRRSPTRRNRGLPDSERFDSIGWSVDESGCWNWSASKNRKGYGRFRYSGGQLAHRFALERKIGRPIAPGLEALHSCDNEACVNPEHLSEGTHAENMREAAEKLRLTHAKLEPQDIFDIRSKIGHDSILSIARAHQVSAAAVRAIRDGRNWAWLTEKEDAYNG